MNDYTVSGRVHGGAAEHAVTPPAPQTITLYSVADSPDSARLRAALTAARVRFAEVDIATDPAIEQQVLGWNGGQHGTPTVVFPDGRVLVQPGDEEFAEAVRTEGTITPG